MFNLIAKFFDSMDYIEPFPEGHVEAVVAPENKSILFKTVEDVQKFKAIDLAEYVYISLTALTVMSQRFETAFAVNKYIKQTFRGDGFQSPTIEDTDLYWAIHILADQNIEVLNPEYREENQFYFERFALKVNDLEDWASIILKNEYTDELAEEIFGELAKNLNIKNSLMVFHGRYSADWMENPATDRPRYVAEIYTLIAIHGEGGEIDNIYTKFAGAEFEDALRVGALPMEEEVEREPSALEKYGPTVALWVGSYYASKKLSQWGK